MKQIIKVTTFCIAVVVNLQTVVSADTFSVFNRYDLSSATIRSQQHQMTGDTISVAWFSYVTPTIGQTRPATFSLEQNGQKVTANIATLAGFEYAKNPNRFGALQSVINYSTPHLVAHISANLYTTESQTASPLGDIQFERFLKKDFNKPIEGMFDFRANLPEAYLQLNYHSFTLTTGNQKLRWGPGYKGTLGLSGTGYSPFYFYNLNFVFGTLFHAQSFLCGYEDEVIYANELTTNEKVTVKASNRAVKMYEPRYGAGQRIDLRLGEHVQIGIYELVDFFGSNELNRYANPLQMYYLANEASGTNNANLLAGIDFNLLYKPLRFYGEFINDDITVFEHSGNPNKYALQLGAAYYGNDPLMVTGFEYTHLSKYIYGHSRVLTRHAHWGESMGWPWGNDMDLFCAYALFFISDNLNGKVELNYWLKGDGKLTDEWYADGKPDLDNAPYWPQNPRKIFSPCVGVAYTPISWVTINTFYEPIIENSSVTHGFYAYAKMAIPGVKRVRVD